jgi:hypothetical protein
MMKPTLLQITTNMSETFSKQEITQQNDFLIQLNGVLHVPLSFFSLVSYDILVFYDTFNLIIFESKHFKSKKESETEYFESLQNEIKKIIELICKKITFPFPNIQFIEVTFN